jgi:small subunit ribosomal protein S18
MARGNDRGGDRRRTPKDLGRRGGKKKVCVFCKEHLWVDYKDVNLLRRFQSDRGKIRARRVTGNCTQHHREVAIAIKTARELALLPYTQRTVVERAGGRSLRVPPTAEPGAEPVVPVEAPADATADEDEAALPAPAEAPEDEEA